MPERIPRKRTPGWRMPEGAVYVGRPTKWRNPYKTTGGVNSGWLVVAVDRHGHPTGERWGGFADRRAATEFAVCLFRRMALAVLDREPSVRTHWLDPLAGSDLACWCPLDHPCHADVLLELANGEQQ